MPSKYDAFWQQREEDLARLLHEAFTSGRSQVAVPELRAVGDRQHWSASLSVAAGQVRTPNAAHAKSLGRLLARLSHAYPHTAFRVRITENLHLRIQRAEAEPDHSRGHPTSPSVPGERPRQAAPAPTPGGDLDPAGEGDPARVAQRIHELIWRLPRYTELPPRSALPPDGIYFWFERGEGSATHPRIVRVGINRSPGQFRERIRQHYRGNRRGSAFRLLLGDALLRRRGHHDLWQEWRNRNGPRMPEVESEVSALLAERFSFTYVAVADDEERRRLESWLIACLARGRWPEPSSEWLGNHCSRAEVRRSGLWNIAEVDADPGGDVNRWLARLQELVAETPHVPTGGVRGSKGKAEVLLIIPCSARKEPAARRLFARGEYRRVLDDLPETGRFLAEGRAGNDCSVRKNTPPLAALDYYSGSLYQVPGLKQKLAKAMRENRAEVLILSGGYGMVLADECIRDYEARMNAAYWTRYRLPEVLREFIARRGFRRVYAAAARTTDYATILRRVPWQELSGQLEQAILCTIADVPGGGAQQLVPRALGEVVRTLIDSNFDTSRVAGRTFSGLVVVCQDMLHPS